MATRKSGEGPRPQDSLAEVAMYTDKGDRKDSETIERDTQQLHQYRLAKAVYGEIQEQQEAEVAVQIENETTSLQQELIERRQRQKSHHHLGGRNMYEKMYELELEEGRQPVNVKRKVKGPREVIVREAHKKKRHRISKKRFMANVDHKLIKAVLLTSNLNDSKLWDDDFDVNKLSVESIIICRKQMLKMEVIVEALKEGLFDKANAPGDAEPELPTEEMLLEFEANIAEQAKLRMEFDTEAVLEFAKHRAKALGLGKAAKAKKKSIHPRKSAIEAELEDEEHDKEAAMTAFNEAKQVLIRKEQERRLQDMINGLDNEDAFTKLVKTIREPDSPEDEWSINESTTTGSYLSWRKVAKPKNIGKPKKTTGMQHLKRSEADEKFLNGFFQLTCSLIIIGYWIKYAYDAADNAFYDIYSEELHASNVWMLRDYVEKTTWNFLFFRLYDWYFFFFTLLAPLIVLKNNTSLGVIYGFSLLIDAALYMFSTGHDLVYDSGDLSTTVLLDYFPRALFYSLLFLNFIIYHYVSDNQVKIEREFSHRKNRRLNRIVYAKNLGNFEQRMLAWEWMIHRARLKALRKLARQYPEIRKVNGHYPIPEDGEIKFDLRKELRLFRLRHCFYDVHMKGGWVNLEKYQENLFGSGESSEEEVVKPKQQPHYDPAKIRRVSADRADEENGDRSPPTGSFDDQKRRETMMLVGGPSRQPRKSGVEEKDMLELSGPEVPETTDPLSVKQEVESTEEHPQGVPEAEREKRKTLESQKGVTLEPQKRATLESPKGKRGTLEKLTENRPTLEPRRSEQTETQEIPKPKEAKRKSDPDKDKT